jgi:radical SAM protein with 4Fe4S-binding SPASM domain
MQQLFTIRRSRDADRPPPIAQLMTGDGALRSVWLQITSRCNQTCEYCYMSATKESHERLDLAQIRRVFEVSRRLGAGTMLISGGEPTIVKELPDILRMSRLEFGFTTYLVTNGSGVTDKLTTLLSELGILVQVSMDTMDEEAYAKVRGLPILDRIKKNVVRMVDRCVPVALSIPITNVIDSHVQPVLEWGIEIGVQNVHVATSYGQRTGVTEDLTKQDAASVLDELYAFEKENYEAISIDLIENMLINMSGAGEPCATYCTPMAGNAMEVMASGAVFYCGAITSVPEMSLGNILDPSFELDYLERRRTRSHLSFTPDRLPICSTCEYVAMCKGGCRSQALYYANDLHAPVTHCADLKRVFGVMTEDYRAGRLDDLLDFLRVAYGGDLRAHTKCF